MKINVILSVDIIRPPLTGIGHYALRLARGLNHNPAIGSLRFFPSTVGLETLNKLLPPATHCTQSDAGCRLNR